MIALPPGCTVSYSITIDVDKLTDEMVDWFRLVEGKVYEDTWYNHRGQEKSVIYVSYGKGKRCHHHNNGADGTRLHFLGDDASAASMFILKFSEHVIHSNLKDRMKQAAHDAA